MPRRAGADHLAKAVGKRLRSLREDVTPRLTLEGLAYGTQVISKGHLSDLEAGRVRVTVHTLKKLADQLDVKLVDVVTFPDEDDRQKLIDLTRKLSPSAIRRLLREAQESVPSPSSSSPK
jgi:transcriptional regulator with XRE-family HTH domain